MIVDNDAFELAICLMRDRCDGLLNIFQVIEIRNNNCDERVLKADDFGCQRLVLSVANRLLDYVH